MNENLIDLLTDLEEYMDNKSDAEGVFNDIDCRTVGNKEMDFLMRIREALEKLEKQ